MTHDHPHPSKVSTVALVIAHVRDFEGGGEVLRTRCCHFFHYKLAIREPNLVQMAIIVLCTRHPPAEEYIIHHTIHCKTCCHKEETRLFMTPNAFAQLVIWQASQLVRQEELLPSCFWRLPKPTARIVLALGLFSPFCSEPNPKNRSCRTLIAN